MSEVEIQLHDGWAEVILNRPQRKNAITGPLGTALAQSLQEVNALDEVRVVVLRGADGAFCSGLDLKEFNADEPPDWLQDFQPIWRSAHRSMFECSKPIIGALERFAINGGAALALACDLLVVGEGAFLQVGEVQMGMAAPYNLAWLGLRHAETTISQVALVGDRIYGPELLRLGVAQEVTGDDEVVGSAHALAQKLADYPEGGLERIKAGVRARLEYGADAWFDRYTGN